MSEQAHPTGHAGQGGTAGLGDGEENTDLAVGMAVAKGALAGIPIMLVFISAAVWLITDQSAAVSIVTAMLPGVLFGAFGGGFLGILRAMGHH